MTLVDFLLERIAEDEAAARAASPGVWQYCNVDSVAGGTLYDETRSIASLIYEQPRDHDGTIVRHLLVPEADANGAHIARHDPARVLAECKAKRRIVETSQRTQESLERRGPGNPASDAINGHVLAYRDVVRTLASVYAAHEDYDPAWRLG